MKKRANLKLQSNENPEWTGADFKQSKSLSALPKSLQTKLRGRPPKESPKVAVKLRLDQDVLTVLRATGAGWQTRVNSILRERFVLQ